MKGLTIKNLKIKIVAYLFITLNVCLVSTLAHAEIITLPSDQEITIEEYGLSSAKNHILWMHSEHGISGELQEILLSISKETDIQILLPDWLDSYFIEPSHSSLEKIPDKDYNDLIAHYAKLYEKSDDNFYLVANGRAASLVLNSSHLLQTRGLKGFDGIILLSPYLQKQTPDIGKTLDYQTITSHSNLPLYIFQAERSPRFIPFPLLIEELEKGGSQVFAHRLKNVSGGFHVKNKNVLTDVDLKARKEFPQQISNALSLLKHSKAAPLKPIAAYQKNIRKQSSQQIQNVNLDTPSLILNDIDGKPYDLNDYKGKTILISFWASWCRPCLEEMPSLVKLKEKYKENLEILAVDVGEDKKTIQKFTGKMNINFPILQDLDSSTTKNWKVYVYPSNYIIDKTGKLRYAAKGALDWQEPEIEAVLDTLY